MHGTFDHNKTAGNVIMPFEIASGRLYYHPKDSSGKPDWSQASDGVCHRSSVSFGFGDALFWDQHTAMLITILEQPYLAHEFDPIEASTMMIRLNNACRRVQMPMPIIRTGEGQYQANINPSEADIPSPSKPWPAQEAMMRQARRGSLDS
jgi:hypothetical protein